MTDDTISKIEPYHYTMSGLRNIWLQSGFNFFIDENKEENLEIASPFILHTAIGKALISTAAVLTGEELRFLRCDLSLSHKGASYKEPLDIKRMAALLGIKPTEYARMEKDKTAPINGAVDRLVRIIYSECHDLPIKPIYTYLEAYSGIDQSTYANVKYFANWTKSGWIISRVDDVSTLEYKKGMEVYYGY